MAQLGVRRVTVLLLYVALFALGVPVWWRTTEVYRAAIPFDLLDAAGGEGLPRLAVRLVLAQKLLSNHKMAPMETLYFISPLCVVWMVPFILLELPVG